VDFSTVQAHGTTRGRPFAEDGQAAGRAGVVQPGVPESLRERKKRLTRTAIFEAAQRLFAERGFERVTVAEIADEANISVKTLFMYVRSKEELLFGDGPTILDAVVAAVRNRKPGETPLVAAAKALLAAVAGPRPARGVDAWGGADVQGSTVGGGFASLEAFSRMARSGPEARARLRALWEQAEDALTVALARPKDGPAQRAARRLEAAQIMVLVRATTSDEVHALVVAAGEESGGRPAQREAMREWIRDAAGSLARGLQASRR
jgi:AcrR family transcriptional regulator